MVFEIVQRTYGYDEIWYTNDNGDDLSQRRSNKDDNPSI
jgi:hypothetical protein